MATRETRRERGRRRSEMLLRRLGDEMRTARMVAGLSQRAVAVHAGWTQSELHRFERGQLQTLSLVRVCQVASVLGFEINATVHPIGDGLRDRGQQAAIARLSKVVHPSYRQAREVPFPTLGDLRSWDMTLRLADFLLGVEVETRVRDVQELVRRIRQREIHGGVDAVLIVLAATAHNRAVADELRQTLGPSYMTSARMLRDCLRLGRPCASGVLLI
jgi:transcriptional regulator with XRE-family HTH domain